MDTTFIDLCGSRRICRLRICSLLSISIRNIHYAWLLFWQL